MFALKLARLIENHAGRACPSASSCGQYVRPKNSCGSTCCGKLCSRNLSTFGGGMEFVQAVAQFFDSALYYAKVGYESTRKAEVTHVLTAP